MDTISILKLAIILFLIIYIIFRYIATGSVINLFIIFLQCFSGAIIFLKEIYKTEINNELYYTILFLAILFPTIILFHDAIFENKLIKKHRSLFKFHHYLNREIELDTNELIRPFPPHNIMIYDRKKRKEFKSLYEKANKLILSSQYVEASIIYELLISLNKKNPLIYFNYACLLFYQNKYDDSFNFFLKTNVKLRFSKLKKKRRDLLLASSYYNAGNVLFHQNKLNEAMFCYKKSIKLNVNNVMAKENIVIIYLAGSNFKEAYKVYNESIKKHNAPFLFNLHLFMGKILEKKNLPNEALEAYNNAKAIKKDVFLLHSIARILYNINRIDEAVSEYLEITKKYPDDEKVHIGLGLSYFKKGEIEKAKKAFLKVLHLRESKYNYIYILYKNKEYTQALPYIRELLDNVPTAEDFRLAGSLYMKLGRYYEAMKNFRAAYEIEPNNFKTAYNLGLTHAMIKDYHTAKNYFEDALDLKKNDPEILVNLIKVNIKINDIRVAKKYLSENLKLLINSDISKDYVLKISETIDLKGGNI